MDRPGILSHPCPGGKPTGENQDEGYGDFNPDYTGLTGTLHRARAGKSFRKCVAEMALQVAEGREKRTGTP